MKILTSRLTPSRPNAAPPPQPKLDSGFDVGACSFGHYPWDDWHRFALARGLDAELAGQGRLLVREAFNHDWPGWLKSLGGWCRWAERPCTGSIAIWPKPGPNC